MLLAAILLIWASQAASPPEAPDPPPTRSGVIAGYQAVLTAHDEDGDGSLGLAEWTAMIDLSFPSQPRPGEASSNYAEVRAYLIADHGRADRDRDGMVTLDELTREPLANFDCMDGDHDLRLSEAEIEAEIESGLERCPSGPAVRIGFISEPPADGTPTR